MNLEAIKNAVTSKVGRQILTGQKHSPTILFAVGVVGIVATAVAASKATLKLDEVLDENDKKKEMATELVERGLDTYTEIDYKKDMLLLQINTIGKVAKLYAPAIALGLLSIGALTGSHVTLTRRNVGLTAAYAAVQKSFAEYRERAMKVLGPEKERELRYDCEDREIVVEGKNGPETKNVKVSNGKGPYSFLFDERSSMWSKGPMNNQLLVKCQQQYANDILHSRGHLFLNEVLDMLGLPRVSHGQLVGWVLNKGGDNFVDFGLMEGDQYSAIRFVNGDERSIWLDFNVDGVVYDLI